MNPLKSWCERSAGGSEEGRQGLYRIESNARWGRRDGGWNASGANANGCETDEGEGEIRLVGVGARGGAAVVVERSAGSRRGSGDVGSGGLERVAVLAAESE